MAPAKTKEEKLFHRRLQQMIFYALQRKRGYSIDDLVHKMLPHFKSITRTKLTEEVGKILNNGIRSGDIESDGDLYYWIFDTTSDEDFYYDTSD